MLKELKSKLHSMESKVSVPAHAKETVQSKVFFHQPSMKTDRQTMAATLARDWSASLICYFCLQSAMLLHCTLFLLKQVFQTKPSNGKLLFSELTSVLILCLYAPWVVSGVALVTIKSAIGELSINNHFWVSIANLLKIIVEFFRSIK